MKRTPPTVMNISATLNIAGKYFITMKSTTLPNLNLSIIFPSAPPMMKPKETLPNLPTSFIKGRTLKNTATTIDTHVIISVYEESIPKAIPVFVVLTIHTKPGIRGNRK